MPGGATAGKFTVKSCGKAHPWCAECRPAQAAAQRKPKPPQKKYDKSCRNCGRCDDCLGIAAPAGMKFCRKCEEAKPLKAFSRRSDTGGYRNKCVSCINKGVKRSQCEGCGNPFTHTSLKRNLCPACRPPITKPCARCGGRFVGSMDHRRYCSPECRDATAKEQREKARIDLRLEALRAYSGPVPSCACCGEATLQFLALDHIYGGGGRHRKKTGGGGFYTWLRREGYPPMFQVLCHNCNMGRQFNGGVCPHKVLSMAREG